MILALGCGVEEQPPAIIEAEADSQVESVMDHAPERERSTGILTFGSGTEFPYMTRVKEPMKVFVAEDGQLVVKEIVFQEAFYYLLRPGSIEIDGVSLKSPSKQLEGVDGIFFNVLDQKIRPPSKEVEAVLEAAYRKELGIGKDEPLTMDQDMELSGRILGKYPIREFDELEIVIKHRFTYKTQGHQGRRGPKYEMIFADGIRNLTRPHIKY